MLLVVLRKWKTSSRSLLYVKDNFISVICLIFCFGLGTSIVYAATQKHTKVEFPEARIYEETLQILLYEDRNIPDQELLQATASVRGIGTGISTYTSDEEEGPLALRLKHSNS